MAAAASRELILSVGTHKGERRLSPLEVADSLAELIDLAGMESALRQVALDESTARRFLKLKTLDPRVGGLVGWGSRIGTILFSTAAEIARVPLDRQFTLAECVIRSALSKEETRQVVQLVSRRGMGIAEAVDEVLRMRPTTISIHVTICAITEDWTQDQLASMTQVRRDELLRILLSGIGSVTAGRLSLETFTVSSSVALTDDAIVALERDVNEGLQTELSKGIS